MDDMESLTNKAIKALAAMSDTELDSFLEGVEEKYLGLPDEGLYVLGGPRDILTEIENG